MFSPGDTVVYRHHVCSVAGVREAYYEGRDYLELHALFEKSLKFYVAVDEAQPPALRPVMSKREALSLIDSIADAKGIDESGLKTGSSTPTLMERRLKEEYEKRLKTFSPEDLIPIMKSVHEHAGKRAGKGRAVTATDKKYFDLAENLLCDELSISLDIDRESVKDFLVERVKKAEARRR